MGRATCLQRARLLLHGGQLLLELRDLRHQEGLRLRRHAQRVLRTCQPLGQRGHLARQPLTLLRDTAPGRVTM